MKRIFSFFPVLLILIFLICFPQISLTHAKAGLMLWFYTLLPSMLPFMILSSLLVRSRAIDSLLEAPKGFWHAAFGLSPSGTYALLMGIFCGYPMGAKVTADLYRECRISRQEASYLLTFCNHPGPSFLSAYLCIGLFKRPDLIVPSYGIIYTSSFLCSLFFRFIHTPVLPAATDASFCSKKISSPGISPEKKEISKSPSFSETLDISILNSFESITKLGGYIILFSILQGILKQFTSSAPRIQYLISGLTEITTGLACVCNSSLPFGTTFPLSLAFTAFGGLCVTAQTKSMLAGTDLPMKSYVSGRIFCGLCTFSLGILSVKIIKIVV